MDRGILEQQAKALDREIESACDRIIAGRFADMDELALLSGLIEALVETQRRLQRCDKSVA